MTELYSQFDVWLWFWGVVLMCQVGVSTKQSDWFYPLCFIWPITVPIWFVAVNTISFLERPGRPHHDDPQ